MRILTSFIILLPFLVSGQSSSAVPKDYWAYHEQINKAETLLADERFEEALKEYWEVFESYEFVFVREYKIAAQLALYLDQKEKAFQVINKGITAGWDLKSLKKNDYLARLHKEPKWKAMEVAYPDLRKEYLNRIDQNTREEVHEMFKKDQKKAMGAVIRMGNKAREKYALEKFAPHSEIQVQKLIEILKNQGYPGERLIGNDFWTSTILSHHNSIATAYVKKDTLFDFMRPKLIDAIGKGQMSTYEFALVEDWRIAVASARTQTGYGFLDPPSNSSLEETNELREKIGLRSVELRNRLVDVENKTGMNFYLPDWIDGKIKITSD